MNAALIAHRTETVAPFFSINCHIRAVQYSRRCRLIILHKAIVLASNVILGNKFNAYRGLSQAVNETVFSIKNSLNLYTFRTQIIKF